MKDYNCAFVLTQQKEDSDCSPKANNRTTHRMNEPYVCSITSRLYPFHDRPASALKIGHWNISYLYKFP